MKVSRRSYVKASVRLNLVMLQFCWELGRDIVEKKAESHWEADLPN